MQASDHPTADTLHSRVCGVSKATVYNALEAFARVGLAQAIPGPGGVTRWDAVTGPHVHVRHIDDDRVEDLPDPLATQVLAGMTPEVIDHIEASLGVHVDAVQVSLLVREA